MKALFLGVVMIMVGAAAYYYLAPFLQEYKKVVDYQTYQSTNLLEGIDVKPVHQSDG